MNIFKLGFLIVLYFHINTSTIYSQTLNCYVETDNSLEGRQLIEDFHAEYKNAVLNNSIDMTTEYTIPIVVHSFKKRNDPNSSFVTSSLIDAMISKLNLGFGGINDGFNTRVHFVAATRNPLGLCINGIDEVEVEDPDYSCGSPNNGIRIGYLSYPDQKLGYYLFQGSTFLTVD